MLVRDKAAFRFIVNQIPSMGPDVPSEALWLEDSKGKYFGAVCYNNYRIFNDGAWIEFSGVVWNPEKLTRGHLKEIFYYPFGQLKVSRMQSVVKSDNRRACDVLRKLGFKHEGTLRLYYDGKHDAEMFSMLPRECKWWRKEMGKPGQPKPPDPMETARQQSQFNRDSLMDAITASQIGQATPWGGISYTGAPGSPDRRMSVSLNPMDQQRLDMQRQIQKMILGQTFNRLGAKGGSNGMVPPRPTLPRRALSPSNEGPTDIQ